MAVSRFLNYILLVHLGFSLWQNIWNVGIVYGLSCFSWTDSRLFMTFHKPALNFVSQRLAALIWPQAKDLPMHAPTVSLSSALSTNIIYNINTTQEYNKNNG